MRIGDARGRSCGEGTAIGGALALGQRRCMQAKQRSGCGRLGCVRRVVHIAEWAHSRVKRADACALLALGCWVCCAGGGRGGAAGVGNTPIVFTWIFCTCRFAKLQEEASEATGA